ncbi:peptidoglycan-binding protein [Streptomyces sp. enrichment culture]|uniref:peptidoglycan-binding domain-containing protein n=1 Tax=Streptomyces sp. enrichment culture TaxID=1795815 RepID=UPI003F56E0F3
MRAMTRTLVSVTTAVGIAAGGVAVAGTSHAATNPDTQQASVASIGTEAYAPLAVVNLGLTNFEAQLIQGKFLRGWGYTGPIDGQLGPDSWKAFQRRLSNGYGYNGAIDGIVGSGTVKALQRYLKTWYNYTGAIDGIAGPQTTAAFKSMARVT